MSALALEVGGEALQIADGHGLVTHLQVHALAFALLLLGTYTSAHGRQGRGALQHTGCIEELATLYVLDERRYVDVHGTTLHTCGVGAIQTTLCLGDGLLA